ncbi:putative laccase-19 [Phragmites australis]|uniref:putative laccase-19 n=1 Tax=Phragmites australis TaxID=29695 RepID=UPI002D7678F7|nr:putative laccase-19 [Phragmites australis]
MAVLSSDSNLMHLHGYDVFMLAQDLGNYNVVRDVVKYNLVDPLVRNTVLIQRLGWATVRFVGNNPGVWYMHCQYEFHVSMGMAAAFIVEDGPMVDTALPPLPVDFLKCDHDGLVPDESFLQRYNGKNDVAY